MTAPEGRPPRTITVYCGSSNGAPEAYMRLADATGRAIAGRGWGLVYGGGSVGLMRHCAEAALAAGGEVTGVITRALADLEVAHPGLTALHIVDTMHERKRIMSQLGDAFLILPGGFGTLDEAMEAITWRQLGIHQKPLALLEYDDFWKPFLAFLARASELRFIRPGHLALLQVAETIEDALDLLAKDGQPADGDKWWLEA